MALFLDRHDAPGATATDIAAAHALDVAVQDKYGVRYVTYWFDDGEGTVFCLAEGPDRESLEAVHREAHGLVADNIIEVGPGPINTFLGEPPRHATGEAYVESAVRAIVFTDLCDSTRHTQELGDEAFMPLLRAHDEIVRTALGKRGGREVKHTGDGIMAAFTSAFQAVSAAMQIQRALRERDEPAQGQLHVRVGVAAGEPVTEQNDLFGAAVQQAARLCAWAQPDCIVVSSGVQDLCRGKGIRFSDGGPIDVKGFDEPIGHFEVEWRD